MSHFVNTHMFHHVSLCLYRHVPSFLTLSIQICYSMSHFVYTDMFHHVSICLYRHVPSCLTPSIQTSYSMSHFQMSFCVRACLTCKYSAILQLTASSDILPCYRFTACRTSFSPVMLMLQYAYFHQLICTVMLKPVSPPSFPFML